MTSDSAWSTRPPPRASPPSAGRRLPAPTAPRPWSGTGSGAMYEPKPAWQTDPGLSQPHRRRHRRRRGAADRRRGLRQPQRRVAAGRRHQLVRAAGSGHLCARVQLPGIPGPIGAYQAPGMFTDIVSGSNGTCSPAHPAQRAAAMTGRREWAARGASRGHSSMSSTFSGSSAIEPRRPALPKVQFVLFPAFTQRCRHCARTGR